MSLEERRNQLVDELITKRYLKTNKVIDAFRNVPRHEFMSKELIDTAYEDRPLIIGEGQTISAPHMVAIMTELLDLTSDLNILEIGCGSGYQAAILSEISPTSTITTIERIPGLAKTAGNKLENLGYSNVTVVLADGSVGYSPNSPYDRIIVTAGSPKISDDYISQLTVTGKLLIPAGDRVCQTLKLVEKIDGKLNTTTHGGCVFVPLIGKNGWN